MYTYFISLPATERHLMERRLAAILVADMVGYSRLMEADETGTLTRQKRHRAELIDPRIAAHHGHIVKLTGDGMIAEFPSVVEAVQCAVSIQRTLTSPSACSIRLLSYLSVHASGANLT